MARCLRSRNAHLSHCIKKPGEAGGRDEYAYAEGLRRVGAGEEGRKDDTEQWEYEDESANGRPAKA